MDIQFFLPGLICIVVALLIMFRLMHYAHFYASSYFFWIGAIITLIGIISLIHPLAFLFIFNRIIAVFVTLGGMLISIISLLCPTKEKHSPTNNLEIDKLLPDYTFNEFHDVLLNASPEKAKQALQTTGVNDIPAAHLLMKTRGIARKNKYTDMSDRAAKSQADSESFSTPDFNFFVPAPDEFITVMIIKSNMLSKKSELPAPPEIKTLEQFQSFNAPGYIKVAANFRFIDKGNNKTLLSTETRNQGTTLNDNRIFARYWRMVYPGSAIIRRVWLDTIKKEAGKNR